ncbi:MAG TPA: serine--tRNA ligase [Candidatus Paceibacterota bacterium]
MLDIKFIRENKDIVITGAKKKGVKIDIDELISLDDKRRELLSSIEKKRAEQNVVSESIIKATPKEKEEYIESMKHIKSMLQEEEAKLSEIMKKWQTLMLQVPNIPDMSVPEGKNEADNVVVKTWGNKTVFNFEPKDHVEIMTKLKMLDIERGTKVHGFRGYYLIGDGARLCFAVWNYALDFFSKKNFNLIIPPSIVRKINFYGTGHLPSDVDDYYMTQDGDGLIATAEISLMGFHSDEMLSLSELPKRYLGFSPCYRREAGAHSKDLKGLIRVHEFFKFEQLILCEASHDVSVKFHEELNRNTEEFIESLGLPYQTIITCTGDLGRGHVKMYDIELWVPKENKYREISSASYFHDFQARRCNIRYKDAEGKMKYVHSLNATAIPTPRILVSMIENFQEKNGSIRIPEVLVKYFGKERIG